MELLHLAARRIHVNRVRCDPGLLTLVDLTLTGSLLIIVIFSGTKISSRGWTIPDHGDRPEWMGTIDFAALKLKMLSSIVAISAVQLLRQFMSLGTVTPEREKELMWLVIIHLVFVVSSVLLGAFRPDRRWPRRRKRSPAEAGKKTGGH